MKFFPGTYNRKHFFQREILEYQIINTCHTHRTHHFRMWGSAVGLRSVPWGGQLPGIGDQKPQKVADLSRVMLEAYQMCDGTDGQTDGVCFR